MIAFFLVFGVSTAGIVASFIWMIDRRDERERSERRELLSRIQAPEATAALVLDEHVEDIQSVRWDDDGDFNEAMAAVEKLDA